MLKKLNMQPMSEQVFELVVRKYCDKGNTKEINYFKFCQDVDRPEDMFPGYTPKNGQTEQPLSNTTYRSNFFADSTRGMNVIQNRFS